MREQARLPDLLAKARVLASGAGAPSRTRLGAKLSWVTAAVLVCGAGAAIGAGLARHVSLRLEDAPTLRAGASEVGHLANAAAPTLVGERKAAPSDEAPMPPQEVHSDAPAAGRSGSERSQGSPHARDARATAASLFEGESDARRQGDYAQALFFHRELEARFGLSVEAQVSRAVMGRGLLDRGRAEDALACFDDYLAFGSGDLGEEVMAGRATALERLERTDDARAAWQRLLETYPSTSYASRATARLEKAL